MRPKFGKGGFDDCLYRGLGPYPVRQTRRRKRRKPDRAGCRRGAGRCRHRAEGRRRDRARPFQRRFLGAGFYRLVGAANLARSALQARDPGGKRLRHRLGRRASGDQGDRGARGAHRALRRCRADDDDAGRRDRAQFAESVLCARGSRDRWRLCRHLWQDRQPVFPEMRRPVRCAGHDRRQEPQERRR